MGCRRSHSRRQGFRRRADGRDQRLGPDPHRDPCSISRRRRPNTWKSRCGRRAVARASCSGPRRSRASMADSASRSVACSRPVRTTTLQVYRVYPFWHAAGKIIRLRLDPPSTGKFAIEWIRIVDDGSLTRTTDQGMAIRIRYSRLACVAGRVRPGRRGGAAACDCRRGNRPS